MPEQDGLHVMEDHFYPEIIDSETLETLPDGEKGELVLTTLTRHGMPIIRFRTKDITSLKNGMSLWQDPHKNGTHHRKN